MSLAEDIMKMELYKTFEPYIDTKDITKRTKGEFALVKDAPKEATAAYLKWRAIHKEKRYMTYKNNPTKKGRLIIDSIYLFSMKPFLEFIIYACHKVSS